MERVPELRRRLPFLVTTVTSVSWHWGGSATHPSRVVFLVKKEKTPNCCPRHLSVLVRCFPCLFDLLLFFLFCSLPLFPFFLKSKKCVVLLFWFTDRQLLMFPAYFPRGVGWQWDGYFFAFLNLMCIPMKCSRGTSYPVSTDEG